MQTIIVQKIDGYEIITGTGRASIDAIATEKKIKSLGIKLSSSNRKELMREHAIYFEKYHPERTETRVDDSIIEEFRSKRSEGIVITKDLKVVQDHRGKQAWKKDNGDHVINQTIDLNPDFVAEEPPGPECYYKHNGKKWQIDAGLKSEYDTAKKNADDEILIFERMKKIAKDQLIDEGKL